MRILVVEGDKESRVFLQRGLTGEGFAVDVAEGGHAALDLARRVSYDAILLNTRLPDLPGLSLVSLLRKERYPAVIILLKPTNKKNWKPLIWAPRISSSSRLCGRS